MLNSSFLRQGLYKLLSALAIVVAVAVALWTAAALNGGWVGVWLGKEPPDVFNPRLQWRIVLLHDSPDSLRYIESAEERLFPKPHVALVLNQAVCDYPEQFARIVQVAHITRAKVLFKQSVPCDPSQVPLPKF